MRQFQRQTSSLDIRYVKEYPIPRVKHQGQRPSLVVVPCHIVLYLSYGGLGFLNGGFYLFHKLVHCFQSGRSLSGFKAHAGVLSSVKQEQSLLNGGVYIVVVLEFCYGQQIVPVVLSCIDEKVQILVRFLVNTLCLSVSLQVPGCRRHQLYSEQSIKLPGKEYNKLRSAVSHWAAFLGHIHDIYHKSYTIIQLKKQFWLPKYNH